jgi:hypothetical protein
LIEYDNVVRLKDELGRTYQERHFDFKQLRKFWHGRYWDNVDSSAHGVGQLFKDLRGGSDVGPELKLVHNVLQEVCVKYQTYLAPLPMIRVPTDNPESTQARAKATLKERVLYGLWAEGDMASVFRDLGWFLPLFGQAYIGAFPDFDNNVIRPILRSPENAFPIPSFDPSGTSGVIFSWKVRESTLKRDFPNYNAEEANPRKGRFKRGQDPDPEIELMEFCDGTEWRRWGGQQELNGVQHDYGFCMFEPVKFINVPGEVWGHGAVEQAVSMVEMGNALGSLIFEAALQNVYPPMVVVNPTKVGEEIPTGAGAVIAVNEGGSVSYLSSPNGGLLASSQLLRENERIIKQSTGVNDANFGNVDASVITGKGVNALEGAGMGGMIEMVQGSLGGAIVNWNNHALFMLKRQFAEDTIYLQGVRPRSIADMKPQEFNVTVKGKQITGSFRNEVTFSPLIGQDAKLVMSLQMIGAGLASKQYGRDQVGIPDSVAMDEEIFNETIDGAILGAYVQALTEPTPEGGQAAQEKAGSYLEGLAVVASAAPPAPHPLLGAPSGAAGAPAPGGETFPGGPGGVSAPPLSLPQGAAVSSEAGAPSGAAAAPSPASGGVTVQDAMQAFASVQLAGRAWLVGQIAAEGQTSDAVEVAVTDDADRQTLQAAATFPVVFHKVAGEPQEESVEIVASAQPVAA